MVSDGKNDLLPVVIVPEILRLRDATQDGALHGLEAGTHAPVASARCDGLTQKPLLQFGEANAFTETIIKRRPPAGRPVGLGNANSFIGCQPGAPCSVIGEHRTHRLLATPIALVNSGNDL